MIKEKKCRNIIVMTGAGVSVAAGIPDLNRIRYSYKNRYGNQGNAAANVQTHLNHKISSLPYREALFDVEYFKKHPKPLISFLSAVLNDDVNMRMQPTRCHYFLKLLEENGLLLRNYTTNFDELELRAGVTPEKVVHMHGRLYSGAAKCKMCHHRSSCPFAEVLNSTKIGEIVKCSNCKDGIVLPGLILFGDSLSGNSFHKMAADFAVCDLLIVVGSSLSTLPFANLIRKVKDHCPRILINHDLVGVDPSRTPFPLDNGFDFSAKSGYTRDLLWMTDCQSAIISLVKQVGMWNEFVKISGLIPQL